MFKVTLLFAQMNETPGSHMRIVHASLTMGEFLGIFLDRICWFLLIMCQVRPAGSELSTLLGRVPSTVGYQPTLSSGMGSFQERIVPTLFG